MIVPHHIVQEQIKLGRKKDINMIKDEDVKREVGYAIEKILDFVQVACIPSQWRPVRSKILRYGNDCIRNLTGAPNESFKD